MSLNNSENISANNKINIKNKSAIKQMTDLGKIANNIIKDLEKLLKSEITTDFLNNEAKKLLDKNKVKSALKTQLNFPKEISISINNFISGCVPSDKQILNSGDIVKINIAVTNDSYTVDTTQTFIINSGNLLSNRLVQTAQQVTQNALNNIKPNIKLGDLGNAINKSISKNQNFSIVKDLCGHGIGTSFIEDNYQVKNEGTPDIGLTLQPGMTFTIEPVISTGKQSVKINSDNSCEIKDGSLCALFSHTVLVTDTGMICLT